MLECSAKYAQLDNSMDQDDLIALCSLFHRYRQHQPTKYMHYNRFRISLKSQTAHKH